MWKSRSDSSRIVADEELFFKSGTMQEERIRSKHQEHIEQFIGAALAGIEAPGSDDPEYQDFTDAHKSAFGEVAPDGILKFEYDTVIRYGELQSV